MSTYRQALYDVERNLRLRVEALEREAPGHGNPAELVDIIPGLVAARDTPAEMLGFDTAESMYREGRIVKNGYRATPDPVERVRPAVQHDPAVNGGDPSVKGIRTEVIADHFWLGDDVETDFNLSRHELLVAVWFEGTWGQPRYRKRWKVWARAVGDVLWKASELNVAAVELPEMKGD